LSEAKKHCLGTTWLGSLNFVLVEKAVGRELYLTNEGRYLGTRTLRKCLVYSRGLCTNPLNELGLVRGLYR